MHENCNLIVRQQNSENLQMSNIAIAEQHETVSEETLQMGIRSSLMLREKNADLIGDYVINIGCHDGKSMDDPCYAFYEQLGLPGVCLDAGKHPAIHNNLPWERVRKAMGQALTPGNVVPFLVREKTPIKGHFMKIDIDGIDAQVLKRILTRGFEFDFIQIEVNPEFPPPVRFSVQHHPMFKAGGQSGFYGASCSYVMDIAEEFGYSVLEVDMESPSHDILLINDRHKKHVELTSLEDQFYAAKPGHSHFFFNLGIDCSSWRQRKDYDYLIPEMWNVLANASRIKHGEVLPFVLDVPTTKTSKK